jgi:hypothetical protein
MDEISMLVAETYRHLNSNFLEIHNFSDSPEDIEKLTELAQSDLDEVPVGPGVLYHIQKSTSIFVVRTLASQNLQEDFKKITLAPEDYPSLRLIDGEKKLTQELRYFSVEDFSQAEIIHDQISNRRFPVFEERMCNLSDPGFSWWMLKTEKGFHVSFNLSVQGGENTVKLGPLGDQQLATKTFIDFAELLGKSGLPFNVQNEINRIQFTEGDSFLMSEFQDLFELGVIGEGLTKLFKLLAKRKQNAIHLETTWFYLQELAALRRFWIQVEYDLSAESV